MPTPDCEGPTKPVLVKAAVVQGMTKKRKVVVDGHERRDDEEDDTMLQYASDDEENSTGHRVPGFGIDDDE